MTKIPKLKLILLLIACFLSLSASAHAAELNLISQTHEINVGQQFQIDVILNTEGESINAVEGKIVFPAELLELKEIRDGNSSINFWIEKPHSSQSGVIVFSGITPGGLLGPKELLFSVVFRAKKEGSGTIQTDGFRVLRNDGEGTPANIKISPLQFSISQKSSPISPAIESIKDTEFPEDFKPIIASDPSIFDGKYFLVFVTQDKISGIANYKVREGKWGWFNVAESPYLLIHQSLDRKIFVKAVDKNGNERIAVVEPRYSIKWYENYWIWIIIIILGVIIAYLVKRILWKK